MFSTRSRTHIKKKCFETCHFTVVLKILALYDYDMTGLYDERTSCTAGSSGGSKRTTFSVYKRKALPGFVRPARPLINKK